MSLVKNAHNILLRVVVLVLQLFLLIKVHHPPFLPAFLGVTGNPLFCKLINNRLPGFCYKLWLQDVWLSCCAINGNLTCLVSMPKSMEVNINKQELVKILLFIVQEKISCLRQKLTNRYPDSDKK